MIPIFLDSHYKHDRQPHIFHFISDPVNMNKIVHDSHFISDPVVMDMEDSHDSHF